MRWQISDLYYRRLASLVFCNDRHLIAAALTALSSACLNTENESLLLAMEPRLLEHAANLLSATTQHGDEELSLCILMFFNRFVSLSTLCALRVLSLPHNHVIKILLSIFIDVRHQGRPARPAVGAVNARGAATAPQASASDASLSGRAADECIKWLLAHCEPKQDGVTPVLQLYADYRAATRGQGTNENRGIICSPVSQATRSPSRGGLSTRASRPLFRNLH